MKKSMKLGGGGRFQKLEGQLAAKPGVTDPKALAASIGRKKLGAPKMAELAEKGKERAEAPAKPKGPGLMDGLKSAFGLNKK